MEVGRPRFFISVVPMGLALLMLPKPGTEVPGYYHCVYGTQMYKLQRRLGEPAYNILHAHVRRERLNRRCGWGSFAGIKASRHRTHEGPNPSENPRADPHSRFAGPHFFNKVISLPLSLNFTVSMKVRISRSPRPLKRSRFSGAVGSGMSAGRNPGPES